MAVRTRQATLPMRKLREGVSGAFSIGKSVLAGLRSGSGNSKRQPWLLELPSEILALICLLLDDVDSLVSFSQASRLLRDVSNTLVVWKDFAYRYQCQSRILVLDDLIDPKSLALEDLKRVVIRTNVLESNWSKQKKENSRSAIEPVGPIRTTKISQYSFVLENCEELSSFYISDEFLVIPTYVGHLIIFDLLNNKLIEDYELRDWSGGITIRLHHASRTLYAVISNSWGHNPRRLGASLVKINLPDVSSNTTGSGWNTIVEPIAVFRYSNRWTVLTRLQETKHHRLAILFHVPGETTIKILFFPDWNVASAAICDTGITFINRDTGVGLWFSPDGKNFYAYITFTSGWNCCRYSIAEVCKKVRPWDSTIDVGNWTDEVKPTEKNFSPLTIPVEVSGEFTLEYYWNLSQWWQKFDNVPVRASHVSLHRTADRRWFIVQYYSSELQPFSDRPFGFWLERPVMIVHGYEAVPNVGLSFNHIVWIEKVKEAGLGSDARDKKVLRLASFQEPTNKTLERSNLTRDLDVPEAILDRVHQIFIEPALGCVVITTSRSNDIHRIPFT